MAFFSARQMTYSDKSVTCVPGPCGAVCVSVQSSCVQCGLSAWFEIVAQVVTARDWGHLPFKNTGGAGTHGHTDHTITQTSTGTGEKGTGSPGTGTRTGKKTQGGAGTHVPVKRHRPVHVEGSQYTGRSNSPTQLPSHRYDVSPVCFVALFSLIVTDESTAL